MAGVRRRPEPAADDGLYELDVSRQRRDWSAHIRAVERRTVPLPDDVTQLLGVLEDKLFGLAEDAPATAPRAVAALDRLTRRSGREAAGLIEEAGVQRWDDLSRALGLGAGRARSLVTRYLLLR
ncbi:hypothetical protein [Streptomyces sp. NPDC088760]|uniref:hypothetical protein n=1 Tax=Streptomyces sp. NPDC088760 TaxID=3365890 RepID=UPI003822BB37